MTGNTEIERSVLATVSAIALGTTNGVDRKEWVRKDVVIPGLRRPRFTDADRFLCDDNNKLAIEELLAQRLPAGDVLYLGALPPDYFGHGDRKMDRGTELIMAFDGTILRSDVGLRDELASDPEPRRHRIALVVLEGAHEPDRDQAIDFVVKVRTTDPLSYDSTVPGLAHYDVDAVYRRFAQAATLTAQLHATTPHQLHPGVWLAHLLISIVARNTPEPWPTVAMRLSRIRKISVFDNTIATIGLERQHLDILTRCGVRNP